MKSTEAQEQIHAAMSRLIAIRDSLGATLASPERPTGYDKHEMQRLFELHDRLARAIAAYSRGA